MSTSILFSALKVPTIKRVVITSSMVTLIPMEWLTQPDDRIYTAKDFNPNPSRVVSQPMEGYWTSKALARAAVSDFVKSHTPHFETIQLFPGVVIGADDRALSTADLRNNTPDWSLRMSPVLGEVQEDPLVGVPVDVVDVARAHVDAIRSSIPGNVDYTLSARVSEDFAWDSMIDVAKRHFSDRAGTRELPLGGSLPTMKWRVDSQQTERVFGWHFTTFEDTMKAMIGQYLDLARTEGQGTAE
jgi:nucleoside-diphosphate-sugar epimerase